MRLTFKVALGVLVLVGAAYLFAYPTRTYLDQRRDIAAQEQTIALLKGENAKLAADRTALQTNATIEQIARQEYGLVMPGQQAFMVLPSPPSAAKPVVRRHQQAPWYSSLEFWHQL
jgi:cell division protein FtsB